MFSLQKCPGLAAPLAEGAVNHRRAPYGDGESRCKALPRAAAGGLGVSGPLGAGGVHKVGEAAGTPALGRLGGHAGQPPPRARGYSQLLNCFPGNRCRCQRDRWDQSRSVEGKAPALPQAELAEGSAGPGWCPFIPRRLRSPLLLSHGRS